MQDKNVGKLADFATA